jgi:toxin FitB
MFVLDTNVLSELMRAHPDSRVVEWLDNQQPLNLFTTAITQAELTYGIQLLPRGKKRLHIEAMAARMFADVFRNRVLSFDSKAAAAYGALAAARKVAGRPISPFDAQIAAIALAHGFAVATRNVRDFEIGSLKVLNPWEDSS